MPQQEGVPVFLAHKKLRTIPRDEVARHHKDGDLWLIIDSYVWDVSKFIDMHPGGAHVLLDTTIAGKDATEAFFSMHKSSVLNKYKRMLIGQVEGQESKVIYPTPGSLSQVPYAEPLWLTPVFSSPYYTPEHRALAVAMRNFVDTHVIPEAQASELSGERPSKELLKRMSDEKILHMRLGPGKHLHGLTLPGGMKGEKYDYLAELVVTQELARMAARGFQDGLSAGMWIGLTPILNYGTQAQKAKYIPEVLSGEKHICLAISEAFAGSDVAGVRTTARREGDHYIVNGTKKWITNGVWADYFSTAVSTGPGKMSMLLIERSEGVETKKIATSYSASAGTAYVTFDNVKVPVANLVGEEHKGFAIVLSNFNHERQVMNHFTARQMRMVTEECFKWAHQRKVFGKPLIEQPVIRNKFAKMVERCEAGQAWLEQVTYQMCNMTYAEQAQHLAGPIALLKAYLTRCGQEISDDAVQIFGGRGITKGGMGGMIEMYQRTLKFDAVLGGSEEVLEDLGIKQASKKMPRAVL